MADIVRRPICVNMPNFIEIRQKVVVMSHFFDFQDGHRLFKKLVLVAKRVGRTNMHHHTYKNRSKSYGGIVFSIFQNEGHSPY